MQPSIKTIIIDDEQDGRLVLSSLLTAYCPSIQILGTFDGAKPGMEAIQVLKPDLVFLDIEMPEINGFGLLERMSPLSFEVIFVTAHDHYALKAIKHNALEYLLKPIDIDELLLCIDKFQKKHSHSKNLSFSPEHSSTKIALPVREGFLFIDIEKIVRCEGDGNYTFVFLSDNTKHLSAKTLKDFEAMLPNYFIRIHKSHLVNAKFIKKYIKGDGGYVVMYDESELEVSRRNKDNLLRHFQI